MGKLIKKIFGRNQGNDEQLAEIPPDVITPEERAEEAGLAAAFRVFEKYNAKKTEFLYEMLAPRKKVVFDLVPLLIHIEGAGILKSEDACQMAPHGVFGYEPNEHTEASYEEAFVGNKAPLLHARTSYDPMLPIKSIALIGSLGSIAQNSKSDFDYWIIIDQRVFSRESFIYFQEKLRAIEKWAEEFANAEVHFFPLDIKQVRNDNFGVTRGESSGSALGKLLKEEFYRTLTMVAGQIPLWWVMPPGVDDQDYIRYTELISRSSRIDGSKLIDMGNVSKISIGEFYGAAIWQINKTIGSPFKSILKMAILEEYMHNHGKKGLLCTEQKQRLLSSESQIDLVDPYILMFERAAAYLTQQERIEDRDLLRRSLYMKAGVKLTLADHRKKDLDRKKRLMVNLIQEWEWSHRQCEALNNFHAWSYKDTEQFSKETNAFIIRTYKNVSAELNRQKDEVGLTISQRDLTLLGRKLFIFYSKRTNKIESIKSVIESPPSLEGITIQPFQTITNKKAWSAYRQLLSRDSISSGASIKNLLLKSTNLAKLLTWLVTNQLYDTSTSINLNTGEGSLGTHCTVPDLQRLMSIIKNFFPAYRHSDAIEEELLKKPRIARMLVVINLEEPHHETKIKQTGLIYQNNWGEIFFKSYENTQDGLVIARDFVRKHFKYDPLAALDNFKIYMPEKNFKRLLKPRLDKYFGIKAVI